MPGTIDYDIELLPHPNGIPPALQHVFDRMDEPPESAMELFGHDFQLEIHRTFQKEGQLKKWPKSRRAIDGGGQTLKDTGRLYNSIKVLHGPDYVVAGTPDKRARLLFEGGTVKPKKGKYLTIPADPKVKRRARSYKDTFFYTNKKGTLMLLQKARTKKRKPRVLFFLVKEVTIPERNFIEMTPRLVRKLHKRVGDFKAGKI